MKPATVCTCISLIGLALSGCVSSSPKLKVSIYNQTKITSSQRSAIERAVKGVLKDPDSAKFGKIVIGEASSGEISACGLVNAKNSYGGYTGDSPFQVTFVGQGEPRVSGPVSGDAGAEKIFRDICTRQNLDL